MTKGVKGSGKPKECGETKEVPTGAVTTVHRCGINVKEGHGDEHICRRDNCTYTWPNKQGIGVGSGREE